MSEPHQISQLQRVAVVGTSASGKTCFARELAHRLSIAHIELDALYWQPGWMAPAEPDFRSLVERETARERWVVDGNYSIVRDIVWGRATDVVWLNYPFRLVFRRALLRTVRRAATREKLFAGNRESFRMSFLSRQSILLWVVRTHRRNATMYSSLCTSRQWRRLRFTVLESPAHASAFLCGCANDPWKGTPGTRERECRGARR